MDCCADKDPLIRLHATEALFKLRSGRAASVLIGRLRDKNEQLATRKQAAAALAAIRSYTAIEGLKDLYADMDEDPALRSFVAEELQKIRIR
jgi:HEAT repeat protein